MARMRGAYIASRWTRGSDGEASVTEWPVICQQFMVARYRPSAVRRVRDPQARLGAGVSLASQRCRIGQSSRHCCKSEYAVQGENTAPEALEPVTEFGLRSVGDRSGVESPVGKRSLLVPSKNYPFLRRCCNYGVSIGIQPTPTAQVAESPERSRVGSVRPLAADRAVLHRQVVHGFTAPLKSDDPEAAAAEYPLMTGSTRSRLTA